MTRIARIVTLAMVTLALAGGLAVAAPPGPPGSKAPTCQTGLKCPDLTVEIQQVLCTDLGGGQRNIQVKVRVQNMAANPTWKAFATRVWLDANGPEFELSPGNSTWIIEPPLYGGQVKHLNVKTTNARHNIGAKTDHLSQQPETSEGNNGHSKQVGAAPACG
jgi:hypothetical protein